MPCNIRSPPPPLPLSVPLLFLLLLLLFSFPASSVPYNTYDYSCPQQPSSCGELTSIPFPFWFAHTSDPPSTSEPSSYCGHPDFMLVCGGNDIPILRLGTDNYAVTHISSDNYTISLTDADIFSSPEPCPKVKHNLTFVYNSPWSYASDVNLTFFFNCTPDSSSLADYEISCLNPEYGGSENHYSYVVIDNATSSWAEYLVCEQIFVAPILNASLENLLSNSSLLVDQYKQVLRGGFQLTWPEAISVNCSDCSSGGRCGLNQTSSTTLAFVCFCEDGVTAIDRCGGHGGRKKHIEKVLIIIGVSAFAVLLLLAAGFLFYRLKKKREFSPSSKSLIQIASSKSSAKDPEKDSARYRTHLFSYDELEEATNRFDASRELGDGGFGTVYKGKLRDGRVVAVKRLYENNCRRVEQFMNEVEILSRLRHQNLVDLYGCTSRHSRELLLVYEFVANGTVADHLHGSRASEGVLTWPMRLNIAIETADALAYLHAVDPPIIHRDVKTSNILLDGSFHVKVADFGLSRLFPTDVTHISTAPQGTPGYLDPEYHECYQLTHKSDVYSFGVVLIELISSKPAVDITRHRKEINLANMAINRIQNGEIDQLVDEGLGYHSDEAVKKMITMVAEVAFRCLQLDGDMRPSIKEVLEQLRAIQRDGYKVAKEGKDDDADLLKSIAPGSPDCVINQWVSMSTTPNASE